MSARKITFINSRISHFALFIYQGRLQPHFFQFWLKRWWSQHAKPLDNQIQLDQEYLSHLQWFCRLEVLQGVPLRSPEPALFFFMDALLVGWGTSWQNQQTMDQWLPPEQLRHINWLELETVRLAICHWGLHWSQQTVHVYCDNSTAVAYICKQGGERGGGGGTFSLIVPQDTGIIPITGQIHNKHDTYTSARSSQHDSRQAVAAPHTEPNGMACTAWSILCLRDTTDRHVCNSGEQGDADLHFTLARRLGLGGRRSCNILERIRTDLCIRIVPKTLEKIRTSRGTTVKLIASQHLSRPWHPLLLQLSVQSCITKWNSSSFFPTNIGLSFTETHACWTWSRVSSSATSSDNTTFQSQ